MSPLCLPVPIPAPTMGSLVSRKRVTSGDSAAPIRHPAPSHLLCDFEPLPDPL